MRRLRTHIIQYVAMLKDTFVLCKTVEITEVGVSAKLSTFKLFELLTLLINYLSRYLILQSMKLKLKSYSGWPVINPHSKLICRYLSKITYDR